MADGSNPTASIGEESNMELHITVTVSINIDGDYCSNKCPYIVEPRPGEVFCRLFRGSLIGSSISLDNYYRCYSCLGATERMKDEVQKDQA